MLLATHAFGFQPSLEPLPLAALQPTPRSADPHPGPRYWLKYRARLVAATRAANARAMEPPLAAFVVERVDGANSRELEAVRVDNSTALDYAEFELRTLETLVSYPNRLASGLPDGEALVHSFRHACRLLLEQRRAVTATLRFLATADASRDFYASNTEFDGVGTTRELQAEAGATVLIGGRLRGLGAERGSAFIDLGTEQGVVRIRALPHTAFAILAVGRGALVVLHVDPNSGFLHSITQQVPNAVVPVFPERQVRTWLPRLTELRALRAGWDTYDAPPIDERALDRLEQLVGHLLVTRGLTDDDIRKMNVGPSHDGGVAIEWDTHGRVLHITIERDGKVVRVERSDDEAEERISERAEDLSADIEWLHQAHA